MGVVFPYPSIDPPAMNESVIDSILIFSNYSTPIRLVMHGCDIPVPQRRSPVRVCAVNESMYNTTIGVR